jgi:hypothetical protein
VHSNLNAYCELQLTPISDDQPHQWQATPRKSRPLPFPLGTIPRVAALSSEGLAPEAGP